jgi:hypothetical protein
MEDRHRGWFIWRILQLGAIKAAAQPYQQLTIIQLSHYHWGMLN